MLTYNTLSLFTKSNSGLSSGIALYLFILFLSISSQKLFKFKCEVY